MRQPEYLSPTSISKFYDDRDEFYLNYLADNRPPRMKQTEPMSVGSAFDAFIKCYLTEKLFGPSEAFSFDEIFETQVEPHNRDFALDAGRKCFEAYLASGALASLMRELELAASTPKFEFTVESSVCHESCIDGIPFLGKPDVYFVTKGGGHVVLDWKVNGYCSSRNTSPTKGYVMCLDGWDTMVSGIKHSRSHGKAHKSFVPEDLGGIIINAGLSLEEADTKWADQTCIYAWVLGEDVGGSFVIGIDQLACGPDGIRVATHRSRVSPSYQEALYARALHVWKAIDGGAVGVFGDLMDEKDCVSHAESLDGMYKMYEGGGGSPLDNFIRDMGMGGRA